MRTSLVNEQLSKPHNGWFAVREESLRTIERTFDREAAVRKATAAYVALLRIANLEGSCVFVRKISQIAKDMSYSYPHAAEALKLVEACRLCSIEKQKIPGTKELGPSKYTVVGAMPQKEPTLEQNVTRLVPTRKSGEGPRITNNSSKNILRRYQEEKGGAEHAQPPASPADAGSGHSHASPSVIAVKAKKPTAIYGVTGAWASHPKLPQIRYLSEKRRTAIATRLRDDFFAGHYEEAIAKLAKSTFCLGENDRHWRADFDWFLKPDTVTRIIEGKYDDNGALAERTDLPSNLVMLEPGRPTVDEVNQAAWSKRMAERAARDAAEAEHFPSP